MNYIRKIKQLEAAIDDCWAMRTAVDCSEEINYIRMGANYERQLNALLTKAVKEGVDVAGHNPQTELTEMLEFLAKL